MNVPDVVYRSFLGEQRDCQCLVIRILNVNKLQFLVPYRFYEDYFVKSLYFNKSSSYINSSKDCKLVLFLFCMGFSEERSILQRQLSSHHIISIFVF